MGGGEKFMEKDIRLLGHRHFMTPPKNYRKIAMGFILYYLIFETLVLIEKTRLKITLTPEEWMTLPIITLINRSIGAWSILVLALIVGWFIFEPK
jgi:hypothetical protein